MLDFIINQKTFTPQKTLIISGTATTNSWDRGSDISQNKGKSESLTVTPNSMKKAWSEYQKAGAKMLVNHGRGREFGQQVIGQWLSYIYEPEDYQLDSPEILKMAIKVICEITNQKVIKYILENKMDSFSMGWYAINWLVNQKTGQRVDTEIIIKELSVVEEPANRDATFTVVTDKDLLEQFNLSNNVEVFGTKAEVKQILKNEKGRYFADVVLLNMKSATTISVQDVKVSPKVLIPNYKVNIKSKLNKIKIDITVA